MFRYGDLVSYLKKIIGRDWSHRAVLIGVVCLYICLLAIDPGKTKVCAASGVKEIEELIVPLTAAIFLAGAVANLSRGFISRSLGEKAGVKGVIKGVAISNILPPCAMVSTPIIKGLDDGGSCHAVTIAMLIGLTISCGSRFFVSLIFFEPKIVGLRILFAFSAAMIVSCLYYLLYASLFSRGCK
jgi:uncharacterized membrane protein YraQ (UPF0718 family)